MPFFDLTLTAITQTLDQAALLARPLFFPELSAIGTNRQRLGGELIAGAKKILKDLAPLDLYRRRPAGTAQVAEYAVTLPPPRADSRWQEPVTLTFHAVVWEHSGAGWLACVPVLGVEIFAPDREELDRRVPAHILFALKRRQETTSLQPLVHFGRCRRVTARPVRFAARIATPRECEQAEGKRVRRSVLKECATRLSASQAARAFEVEQPLRRLAELLGGRHPRSVLLVGPSGVGKTALMHELVRRRGELGFSESEFWMTSGARLVAGMCGFGMWQERCEALCREAARRKSILHLGGLLELIEAGRGGGSGQGIADFLRPRIDRGEIQTVAECTPEQRDLIERQSGGLLSAFVELRLEEPSAGEGRSILLEYALSRGGGTEPITMEGIEKLDRLHRRYATYSVYPGRPIRFLRNLLEDRRSGRTLGQEDVTRAFSRETGLPHVLLDESLPLDLDEVRAWFTSRIIGQPAAVDLIVDLLASVKAGMTRPGRPIVSLLFIGPTGVGKTELAKAIAEFFYQDRSRMIRIDMSEYANPLAVERLIGGVGRREGVLTSQVRDQPFGVVLFDEFEKADPQFFDLLLQVLGEGRLTDASGNVADFRNTIVIMTSNLGVEALRRGGLGFGEDGIPADGQLQEHFTKAVQSFLRPELYNRIDRVVPFRALDEEMLTRIAARELALIRQRDGIQYRGVQLNVAQDVIPWVARAGYDPRYGARPLKRAMERHLLRPLAEQNNAYDGTLPLQAEAVCREGRLDVRVRAGGDERVNVLNGTGVVTDESGTELADEAAVVRRKLLRLQASAVTLEFRNELYRIGREEQRRRKANRTLDPLMAARRAQLEGCIGQLEALLATANSMEEEILLALYAGETVNTAARVSRLETARRDWNDLLLETYAVTFTETSADSITLGIYGEHPQRVRELAAAYLSLAEQREYRLRMFALYSAQGNTERELPREQFWVGKPREPLPAGTPEPKTILAGQELTTADAPQAADAEHLVGLAMQVRGHLAAALLESERGVHVFSDGSRSQKCYVHTSHALMQDYRPPEGIDRRGAFDSEPRRRTYNRPKSLIDDALLPRPQHWTDRTIDAALARLAEDRLLREAESLVDEP